MFWGKFLALPPENLHTETFFLKKNKKSGIQETPTLSTDADSTTKC